MRQHLERVQDVIEELISPWIFGLVQNVSRRTKS